MRWKKCEEIWYNNNMNDKIDILIKYYENLIEELNADQHSNPSYLLGRIDMAEEFIGDLKGLKKEHWYYIDMKELIEKVNVGEITLDQMVALLAAISEVK